MVNLSEYNKENISNFFCGIEPISSAYSFNTFSFIGVRQGENFVLCRGRLFLGTSAPQTKIDSFESENFCASHFDLSETSQDSRSFLEQLATGTIDTPTGRLVFPRGDHGDFTTRYIPFHQEGLQGQNRLDFLSIAGGTVAHIIQQPHADWELKASETPYESLHELSVEFGLGAIQDSFAKIEVIANNVAAVSPKHSTVVGDRAFPAVLVAQGIDKKNVSLGYRVLVGGRVVERSSIRGSKMCWKEYESFQLGEHEIQIPEGAVFHCVVSCSGVAQHHLWLVDSKNAPNSRRAVHNIFDPDLGVLRDFLDRRDVVRQNARDFEIGVSWLLWMLGFSVANLGITNRTRDAVDIVAVTPNGDIAVVECTTGLLKAENKLALLVARTEAVKASLKSSGNAHLSVLPVIVTSKTRDEVRADLKGAKSLGVIVLTREDLDEALNMTLVVRDAQKMFDEALNSLIANQNQADDDETESS